MKRTPEAVSFLMGVVFSLVVLNVMTGTDAFEKYGMVDSGNHLEDQAGGSPFDCPGAKLKGRDVCSPKSQTVMVELTDKFVKNNTNGRCTKLKWSSNEHVDLNNAEKNFLRPVQEIMS